MAINPVPSTPAPSQVVFPWKAAFRTGIQAFIAAAGILTAIAPELQAFVNQFWPGSPVAVWIGTAAVFVAAAATLITRVMAIPAVDALLTQIGLGAHPKSK